MSSQYDVQPAFTPENMGADLDAFIADLPLNKDLLMGRRSGLVTSSAKGNGRTRDGLVDYTPDMPAKRMDWKQTAKTGTFQARLHMRDIKPSMWIASDVLQSRYDSEADQLPYTLRELGYSAVMGMMSIGEAAGMETAISVINDTEIIEPRSQPVRGMNNVFESAEILAEEGSKAGSFDPSTGYKRGLDEILSSRADTMHEELLVVASDFRGEVHTPGKPFSWEEPLDWLASRGNALIAVELIDPRTAFLQGNAVTFRDSGTGRTVRVDLDTSKGKSIRADYEASAKAKQEQIDETLASLNIPHIKLTNADPRWRDSLIDQLTELS
jgi:hypothetical protein